MVDGGGVDDLEGGRGIDVGDEAGSFVCFDSLVTVGAVVLSGRREGG